MMSASELHTTVAVSSLGYHGDVCGDDHQLVVRFRALIVQSATPCALDAASTPCYHLSDPLEQERTMAEADDEKPIQVGPYSRTIQARAVTFTCAHCGQETTIQQYPGYPPRYCSLECKRAVHGVACPFGEKRK